MLVLEGVHLLENGSITHEVSMHQWHIMIHLAQTITSDKLKVNVLLLSSWEYSSFPDTKYPRITLDTHTDNKWAKLTYNGRCAHWQCVLTLEYFQSLIPANCCICYMISVLWDMDSQKRPAEEDPELGDEVLQKTHRHFLHRTCYQRWSTIRSCRSSVHMTTSSQSWKSKHSDGTGTSYNQQTLQTPSCRALYEEAGEEKDRRGDGRTMSGNGLDWSLAMHRWWQRTEKGGGG